MAWLITVGPRRSIIKDVMGIFGTDFYKIFSDPVKKMKENLGVYSFILRPFEALLVEISPNPGDNIKQNDGDLGNKNAELSNKTIGS